MHPPTMIRGARLVLVAGPPITPTRGHCWFLGGEADGLDALLRAVAERASRGVDIVKIMATAGMLTPGRGLHESQYARQELAAVTDATHRAGLPITAHAHGPCGIADAVAVGVDGVEHCSFVGSTDIEPDWSTVAALAEAGTFVGATEAWLPEGPPIPAGELIEQGWANLARMHREGVRIVCCSDRRRTARPLRARCPDRDTGRARMDPGRSGAAVEQPLARRPEDVQEHLVLGELAEPDGTHALAVRPRPARPALRVRRRGLARRLG